MRAPIGAVAAIVFLHATPLLAAEGGELPRIINFAILATILVVVLRKPIASYLDAKTQQIREELADAKQKQDRAATESVKADELLQNLDAEVARAKAEAVRAAEAERERILKAAEVEAKRIQELAEKEVSAAVETGRRQLLAKAAELSVDLAHKKLQSTMTEQDQTKLIDKSIEMLGKTP